MDTFIRRRSRTSPLITDRVENTRHWVLCTRPTAHHLDCYSQDQACWVTPRMEMEMPLKRTFNSDGGWYPHAENMTEQTNDMGNSSPLDPPADLVDNGLV